ncbi:molybdopterin guanine dinucleotide synthesis [Roseisalinus antarcticus]|uniref:Uncharacterized protein n=1 Tax=Roseisalinus antarcticus TaxID=254357 RepID=A0A1Y5RSE9_9RHOB|nr:molybdopterin guanine dinucleotide synthesis [Roseisalinus antarcticus]SLN21615.1 hypothetical protein ROA7023_00574 [Roseisalinus antarcticus]
MRVDEILVVDWSGGNDRGPRPKKDAIWLASIRDGAAEAPLYIRNRTIAEEHLSARIEAALTEGRRLTICLDFAFGYPAGFSRAVTGSPDPLAIWDWLEARIEDAPKSNNRFDVAAGMNRLFPGVGPFWGNALGRDIPDLPRGGRARTFLWPEPRRLAERQAPGAFEVWQLAYAGAVGSQVLMGLPVLARLRRSFAGRVAVWPFEPLDAAEVALVEVWPSLIADAVRRASDPAEIRDAAQVRLLAGALAAQPPERVAEMLAVPEAALAEGWIMGIGHEAALNRAAG